MSCQMSLQSNSFLSPQSPCLVLAHQGLVQWNFSLQAPPWISLWSFLVQIAVMKENSYSETQKLQKKKKNNTSTYKAKNMPIRRVLIEHLLFAQNSQLIFSLELRDKSVGFDTWQKLMWPADYLWYSKSESRECDACQGDRLLSKREMRQDKSAFKV